MTYHTPSILAALVRAEAAAQKAYEFGPSGYTYESATRLALKLMGDGPKLSDSANG
jgi:hypothetical protein